MSDTIGNTPGNIEGEKTTDGAAALGRMIDAAEEAEYTDDYPRVAPDPSKIPAIDLELCRLDRNDYGNAQRLIRRHGADLVFQRKAGWMGWTGTHWSLDWGPGLLQKAAHQTALALKGEVVAMRALGPREDEPPKKFEKRIESAWKFALGAGNSGRIASMQTEAEPYQERPPGDFDAHETRVTVTNGTLNLAAEDDGAEEFDGIVLEPHTRTHLITKCAGVAFDRAAPPETHAPVFMQFLHDIQPDPEIQEFLQRWFGYCLTGSVKEEVIVMFYGVGSNGKSLLMSVMKRLMGDYALTLPFASLLHDDNKRGSEASPDLARLPGARLVTAAEPETGAKFSESTLKSITGADSMIVRHLRQDFFEFKPQFKMLLSFNNKPAIRGQDDGIWRRILLVPFEQKYVEEWQLAENPGAKIKDKGLERKLMKELPGILNWMIDGYRMWAETGLKVPPKILAATSEYRHESNPVMGFIDGWCERMPRASIQAARLYEAYTVWARENATDPMSQTKFGYKLKDMQIEKERSGGLVMYSGIQLNGEGDQRMYDHDSRRLNRGRGRDDD